MEQVNNVSQRHNSTPIYITGDLNLRDINWENLSINPGGSSRKCCEILLNTINTNHLEQMVLEPTRQNSILDLVFTNQPSTIRSIDTEPGISDHNAITGQIDLELRINRKKPRVIHTFARGDIQGLRDEVEKVCTEEILPHIWARSVEENYEELLRCLTSAQANNIPVKHISGKSRHPWVRGETKRLVNKRKRLYKSLKRQGIKPHKDRGYITLDKLTQQKTKEAYW